MQNYKYILDDSTLSEFEKCFYNKYDSTLHPQQPYFDILVNSVNSYTTFLEIGCGQGRIFKSIRPFVKSYVGLEPDKERYKDCLELFEESNTNHDFYNMFSHEYLAAYPEKKFDFVCISHVIQHVSTQTAHNILKDAYNLLNVNGKLIVSTTCVPNEIYTYNQNNISDSVINFDLYCTNNESYNGLPIHMFAKDTLEKYLHDSNFTVINYEQYEFIKEKNIPWFSCIFHTSIDRLCSIGMSQVALCIKSEVKENCI